MEKGFPAQPVFTASDCGTGEDGVDGVTLSIASMSRASLRVEELTVVLRHAPRARYPPGSSYRVRLPGRRGGRRVGTSRQGRGHECTWRDSPCTHPKEESIFRLRYP